MNGRERIALTMQHKLPDRVPVMCQLSLGHYFLNSGLSPHEIWFSSEGFAEALVRLQRRYQFDGILINIPGRPKNLLEHVNKIKDTPEGQLITWDNGHVVLIPWDDNAQYVYSANPQFTQRADFQTINPDSLINLDQYIGYVWNIYHIPWIEGKDDPGVLRKVPDYFFNTINAVKSKVGDSVSIHGEVFSPFTHYLELFGYENGLRGLRRDKQKAKAILETLTESVITWAVAQARYGMDAVLISSAFAGGGFISPTMYQDFVLPYEKKVVEAVKQVGGIVYTHTCGKIGDRLELMAATGTMGIDTLDPPPLGNIELADAKKMIGDRLFLKGNMNSVALLGYKTKEEVILEASERILIGKQGGGYILSSACSIAPHVEPWKIELFTPLAEELGRY